MDRKKAPDGNCKCRVCGWARKKIAQDRNLEANYALYKAGLLID